MEKIRKELLEIARNSYERALLNCDDLFCPYWYCKKIGIDIVKVDDIEDNSCGYIIKKDNKFTFYINNKKTKEQQKQIATNFLRHYFLQENKEDFKPMEEGKKYNCQELQKLLTIKKITL